MSIARHHAEWLSLVEASGPFLSMKVLATVFPQGLDDIDPDLRARLRAAHEEWRDDVDGTRPDVAVHHAWIRYVFREALGFGDSDIVSGDRLGLTVRIPEQHETLTPSFAVVSPPGRENAGKPRLLISVLDASQDSNKPLANRFWKVSPVDRMLFLLRGAQAQGSKIRVGLVTNGDEWVLVHVAPNETATYVTWSSELFFDEPLTLRAFVSLLGLKRFFGVADAEVLETLFADSSKDQHDVTDQLGLQVRRAVEILVQTIDRLDRDRGRVLLKGIPEATLYESAVTVMMRLVFLFAAEEKKLLLLGTPLYDENYAVSTLHDQLQATADRHGEEVLERRHDAWSRLLATFRAVFGGIDHTDLRLPAYGGSLFDPDRFPFLEGRTPGTSWRDPGTSSPLAIDNRTVLHLLRALQRLQIRFAGGGPTETRRLSFRALDIEQIGHVYEGLLDHTAKRATGLTLSLDGKKEPEIAVADLEATRKKEKDAFPAWLAEATGRSAPAIAKALQYQIPKEDERKWLAVCDSRGPVYKRVAPWAGLVRDDSHGNPVVIDEGAVYITEGSDRRSTGTHYTPRSLTEPIVQHTLDPLVYDGPAEGKPREEWVLKPPKDILALRVCDLAMGSGAFLVQACRYLSQKLVEGWEIAEKNAGDQLVLAPNGELSKGKPGDTLVPREVEERLVLARRFVADRCLYGVDVNPMAVEMAKLSLWLITLQKNRPFSFVDHALRCGDSLLGVTSEEQLLHFHLDPARGKKLHNNLLGLDKKMKAALGRSRELREKLESFPVRDISDSKQKAWLFEQANEATEDLRAIGDLLIGETLATSGKKEGALDDALRGVSGLVAALLNASGEARSKKRREVILKGAELLNAGAKDRQPHRKNFHWAVEFPEVGQRGGFDAFVGNPPFMAGRNISRNIGTDYSSALRAIFPSFSGQTDLVGAFFLRASQLIVGHGVVGILASNTIAEGDSREAVLDELLRLGFIIFRARTSRKWPGKASVFICDLHICRLTEYARVQRTIDDVSKRWISTFLDEIDVKAIRPLRANIELWFKGTGVGGPYFDCTESRGSLESEWIKGYCNGKELNALVRIQPPRWIIDFSTMENPPDHPIGAAGRFLARQALAHFGVGSISELPPNWFRYRRSAAALYSAIRGLNRVIVRAQTSSTWAFLFVPTDWLFDQKHVVFATDDSGVFGSLQSCFHEIWVDRFGGSLRSDTAYNPSDCFEGFPLPPANPQLSKAAARYETLRERAMAKLGLGVTALAGRTHDPSNIEKGIEELRAAQCDLDVAVALAYGWTHLNLDHEFRLVDDVPRYTISAAARVEALDRLLALNHARHADEVSASLHGDRSKDKAKRKLATPTKKRSQAGQKARTARQANLFADVEDE